MKHTTNELLDAVNRGAAQLEDYVITYTDLGVKHQRKISESQLKDYNDSITNDITFAEQAVEQAIKELDSANSTLVKAKGKKKVKGGKK